MEQEVFANYGRKRISASFEIEHAPYSNITGKDSSATITLLTATPPYKREDQPKFMVTVEEMEIIAKDMLEYVAEVKRALPNIRLDV